MNELSDLYQQLILDHNAKPHNFGELPGATHKADGHNPLCGDRISIYVQIDANERITDVRFAGQGCAISKASASLMTDHLKGKTVGEAEEIFTRFRTLVTSQKDTDETGLGKLAAFSGVREFPMRVKCATLAWHTLRAALDNKNAPVSTE